MSPGHCNTRWTTTYVHARCLADDCDWLKMSNSQSAVVSAAGRHVDATSHRVEIVKQQLCRINPRRSILAEED